MKWTTRWLVIMTLAGTPWLSSAADEKEGFQYPSDKGGQLLSALLPPSDKQKVSTPNATRREFPGLRSLELPETPLLPSQASGVTLPRAVPPSLKPSHAQEESPLTAARGQPLRPPTPTLLTGLLVRTASEPVETPTNVPILARPVLDRASLDDPTREASLEAALMAVPPARPGPAPFVKLTAPDPFENRETVKVRTPTVESGLPISTSPRPPKP
jgi:hypothetical protein